MSNHKAVRQNQTIQENHNSETNLHRVINPKGLALVIDDEEVIRDLVSMLLFSTGFEVITANGASTGISLCQEQNVDFVITDMHMPDGDGWKVAVVIKETFPDTPVILITGDIDAGFKEDNTPFDAVVLKPFTAKQVLNAVRHVCPAH